MDPAVYRFASRPNGMSEKGVKFLVRLPLLDVTDNGGGVVASLGVIDALLFGSRCDNGNGAKRRFSRRALLSPFPLFSSTLVAVPSEQQMGFPVPTR